MSRHDLRGQVLLVTGAGRGIGAAVARRFHDAGGAVALLDVDEEATGMLAAELGDRATSVRCDVTDLESVEGAVRHAQERFGRIDRVLANAGIAPPSLTVRDIAVADFERTVEIDLLGQWRTARAVAAAIEESRGHILFVGSIYAFFNGTLNASYAMSKAGVEQLGRALRVELAAAGASAGVAYLGFVDTALVDEVYRQPQVAAFRRALPALLTRPMPVDRAADALLRGLVARRARVTAPGWVGPALLARGLVDPLADRLLMTRAAPAIELAVGDVRSARAPSPDALG